MFTRVAVACVCLSSVAGAAYAQSSSRAGLTMGFPGAVGIVWQSSDRLAIRPELSIAKNSSTTAINGTLSASSGWSGGFGLSALVYGKEVDRVRTYFSPRYGWARTTLTSGGTTSAGNASTISGSFGADCAVTKRFSVFGELGVAYGWSSVSIATLPAAGKTTAKTFGIRSGVGMTWYFK